MQTMRKQQQQHGRLFGRHSSCGEGKEGLIRGCCWKYITGGLCGALRKVYCCNRRVRRYLFSFSRHACGAPWLEPRKGYCTYGTEVVAGAQQSVFITEC